MLKKDLKKICFSMIVVMGFDFLFVSEGSYATEMTLLQKQYISHNEYCIINPFENSVIFKKEDIALNDEKINELKNIVEQQLKEKEKENTLLEKKAKEEQLLKISIEKKKAIEEQEKRELEYTDFNVFTTENTFLYSIDNVENIGKCSRNEIITVTYETNEFYKVLKDDNYFYVTKDSVSTSRYPDNKWNINLTDDEKYLLARIVYFEARGESIEGQEAVVEVIFNRIKSNEFPNTVFDVVSAYNQFESFDLLDRPDEPNEMQFEAINNVLYNGKSNVGDAIYFATKPLTNNIITKIGCHYFCIE